MKKSICTALAVILAFSMAFGILPVSAQTSYPVEPGRFTQYSEVPAGYNAHDYNKCVSFLELTDENGVRNGTKVTSGYDPADPTTWGSTWAGDFFAWVEVNGEKRIYRIDISARALIGALDLSDCTALNEIVMSDNSITGLDVSGCTALIKANANWNQLVSVDVSGCTALKHLYVSYNLLPELDISSCTQLEYLTCYSNALSELDVTCCPLMTDFYCHLNQLSELDVSQNTLLETLDCSFNELSDLDISQNTALIELTVSSNGLTEFDVSGCAELRYFDCRSNRLTELDVSQNAALIKLLCSGNLFTELDFSNNPDLAYDAMIAQGSGYIGYEFVRHYSGDRGTLFASPVNGAEFLGFYDASGELISEGEWSSLDEVFLYNFFDMQFGPVYARFSQAVPGDVDNSGSVTVSDAVTALRIAMGLIDGSGFNTDNADMDSNGSVTIADAVVILRLAMGLEQS